MEKGETTKAWGKLLSYCKPYLPVIIVALAFAVIGTIFTLTGPGYLSQITDIITVGLGSSIDLGAILELAVTLIILYTAGMLLSWMQGRIMATTTQKITQKMRNDISVKINKLPLKYFDNSSYGDVLSRVTNDVDTIGTTLNQSIGSLVSAITLFVGALIMMLLTNTTLALVAIAAVAIGFVLMMLIIRKSQKHFSAQQEQLGAMNGHVEEVYSGHNIVKAYNGSRQEKEKFTAINKKLHSSAWKSQFLSGIMMPIMQFIGNFGYAAVCVVGAILAFNGSITFGVIVAFMIYVRLFSQPLSQLAQAATSLQSTAAASNRVFEFLGEEELENEDGKRIELSHVKGDVEFKHVKFGYSEDKTIINDFSAHARPGEKVAIVGPTGAGKTTMVNLLMRFYEVDNGEILIDGIPVNHLTRENVHEQFCMVLQDTWLFEGTIKENIIYSKEGVTDEQVVQACKAVGVHHLIQTLPNGYDTVLDDKTTLSAGEKQLITIARAMVEDAPMLILDEATSSVDTRTEILIQQAMDKLMAGRTSFVIAHRLSTIKNANLILVMKDGDIIEKGTHEELLGENGFYAELYNSQFQKAS
ncbi:ABC transporter ATP-binding protein/permease [Christensenellaceae bacterium OttesenSCG-928-K19]|nr:ABC transporter ATP-binding protein/permease [Christensenellaceae bacterium OttesenSCG-928-K19]